MSGLWQQIPRPNLRLWNNLASLPNDSIYKAIAADDLQAAIEHGTKNWSAGLLACAAECDFPLVANDGGMRTVVLDRVTVAAVAAAEENRRQHDDFDPRTAPSKGAKFCTYLAWFSRPAWAVGPEFWQLHLSVPQLHAMLRFRLGSHTLPIEIGRMQKPPLPRQQRTCQFCDAGSIGDEQHLLLECAATHQVRIKFPALFMQQPAPSMKQFMWQRDRMAVAKYILACLSAVGLIKARA
jgi:hypothetical protein